MRIGDADHHGPAVQTITTPGCCWPVQQRSTATMEPETEPDDCHRVPDQRRRADAAGTPEGLGESALVAVAVDGKSVRGAVDPFGNQVHLLAAATRADSLVLVRSRSARRATKSPCSPRARQPRRSRCQPTRSGHHRRRTTRPARPCRVPALGRC
jgi:hypothetical protein